jgi:hypothetical protein
MMLSALSTHPSSVRVARTFRFHQPRVFALCFCSTNARTMNRPMKACSAGHPRRIPGKRVPTGVICSGPSRSCSLKTRPHLLFFAFLSLAASPACAGPHKESIKLGGVTLSIGMVKDKVLEQFIGYSVRQSGGNNSWVISTSTGESAWLGSVFFKHGKLTLVVKSWGSPGSRTAREFMAQAASPITKGCAIALVQTPKRGSSVKLTSVTCGDRRLVFQISDDPKAGLHHCEVETLGDTGNRLADADFWKPCQPSAGGE